MLLRITIGRYKEITDRILNISAQVKFTPPIYWPEEISLEWDLTEEEDSIFQIPDIPPIEVYQPVDWSEKEVGEY